MRGRVLAALALGLAIGAGAAPAGPPPPTRTNAEMAADILDLAFRLEDGRELPTLTRPEGAVRVRIAGPRPPTLEPELDALLARLRDEAGLDVARGDAPGAEIIVEAVSAAEIARAAPGAACLVVPRARSWAEARRLAGTPALDWATVARRDRALVVVPADSTPETLRDCLHEEVAQALGPLGDLGRVPDTVFNDDNVHGALTGFDMLTLRALHAPELADAPTRAEVARRLPAILARLNPAGERPAPRPGGALALRSARADLERAAFALAAGEAARALELTTGAAATARAHEARGLLATLLMVRAEALDALGRRAEARAARLDSRAPAAYGFGAAARDRAREVRALALLGARTG